MMGAAKPSVARQLRRVRLLAALSAQGALAFGAVLLIYWLASRVALEGLSVAFCCLRSEPDLGFLYFCCNVCGLFDRSL